MPILLTQSDVQKILTMPMALKASEEAFRWHAEGSTQMPPKMYLFFNEFEGDLRVMPCYIPALKIAGVKMVNVHTKNINLHLPTVMATIMLFNPLSGELLAIMDATHITNMRTGAAGAIASKYLARKDSRILGLVGAGAQAETQFMAIREVFPIESVTVWSLHPGKTHDFIQTVKNIEGIRVVKANTIQEACQADIVCTTTPSRKPIVDANWIAPGTHINAIGADAPGKEELDPLLLQKGVLLVDEWEQASHSGEINVPLQNGVLHQNDIRGTLGEVITCKKNGRSSKDEITIFDSTGLAVQDLATAHTVFQEAGKIGLGQTIELKK